MDANGKAFGHLLTTTRVLVVDDDYYSRKVIHTLLYAIGVTDVHEAVNGVAGLEAIGIVRPDLVLLDWEMPGLDGAEFARRVRSPDTFPYPDVPLVMLTGHAEHSRVAKALRLGVHEYLVKPVSSAALRTRLVSVLANPRPIVRLGDYYGPEPRKRWAQTPVEPERPAMPGSAIVFIN